MNPSKVLEGPSMRADPAMFLRSVLVSVSTCLATVQLPVQQDQKFAADVAWSLQHT